MFVQKKHKEQTGVTWQRNYFDAYIKLYSKENTESKSV